jgi:hypothetical protein
VHFGLRLNQRCTVGIIGVLKETFSHGSPNDRQAKLVAQLAGKYPPGDHPLSEATMDTTETLKPIQREADVFWGEIAPCEHLVQIYQDDGAFLDSLEGFVAGGLLAGDAVVVIATPSHLASLDDRLVKRGVDTAAAESIEQYITLDAEETLSKFIVDGWPDDDGFRRLVIDILQRAKKGGRRVRAFGEMVAVLWAQGNNGATVRLEHLWHKLCHEEMFSLFCAYPRSGFTRDASASIKEICDTHSRVVQ